MNDLRCALLLKKTDEGGGVLAGAKFRITTEYPDFEQEYVTTGNPDGEVLSSHMHKTLRWKKYSRLLDMKWER